MKIGFNNVYSCKQKKDYKISPRLLSFRGNDEFIKTLQIPSLDEAKEILKENAKEKISQLKKLSEENYNSSCIKAQEKISKKYPDIFEKIMDIYGDIRTVKKTEKSYYWEYKNQTNVPFDSIKDFINNMEKLKAKTITDNIGGSGGGFAIKTENQKLGKKVIDFFEYYDKLSFLADPKKELKEVLEFEETAPWVASNRDYIPLRFHGKINPTDSKDKIDSILNNTMVKFFNMLEKAEEKYKQTGRTTSIKFYEMQDLINPELNSSGNIACMKDLMQCTLEDYHTNYFFVLSDSKPHQKEAILKNRVSSFINIGDEKETNEIINYFSRFRDKITPVLDEGIDTYKKERAEAFKYNQEIKALEEKLPFSLKHLDELYQDKTVNQNAILNMLYPDGRIKEKIKLTNKKTQQIAKDIQEVTKESNESIKSTGGQVLDVLKDIQEAAKENEENIKRAQEKAQELAKEHEKNVRNLKLKTFTAVALWLGAIAGLVLLITKKVKAKKAQKVAQSAAKPIVNLTNFEEFKKQLN